MAPDQAHNSIFQWTERHLRNDVWLNMYGTIYWLTSNFLIIPNLWLFNKSVNFWAREWYWLRNDHIFVFLSKLTMLYLWPIVSALFSCIWCKSEKCNVRPKETLHLVFILNCLTFKILIVNLSYRNTCKEQHADYWNATVY